MIIRFFTECIKSCGLGHVARSFKLSLEFLRCNYDVSFFVRGDGNFEDFLSVNINSLKSYINVNNFYPLKMEWLNMRDPSLKGDIAIIDSYNIKDLTFFINNYKAVLIFDDDKRFYDLLNIKNVYILNLNGIYEASAKVFSSLSYCSIVDFDLDNCKTLQNDVECKNLDSKNISMQTKSRTLVINSMNFADENAKNCDFLICFGGEDSNNFSLKCIKIFKDSNFNIGVILGANFRVSALQEIQDFVQKSNVNIRIYQNLPLLDVSFLLSNTKHCIVSGGTILLEALNFCKNIAVICVAENQRLQIQCLQNYINIIDANNIDSNILKNFNNKNTLIGTVGRNASDMLSSLVIGCINAAINAKKFKNYFFKSLVAIDFCNVNNFEADLILKCRNHKEVRENMYGNEMLDSKTHYEFLKNLKNAINSKYFLIKYKDIYIGVISLSQINIRHKKAYLGIYKNPFIKQVINGFSLGAMLVDMLKHIAFSEFHLNMLFLEVVATNIKAIRFYEKENFKFIGELPFGFKNLNGSFTDVLIYGLKNENYEN